MKGVVRQIERALRCLAAPALVCGSIAGAVETCQEGSRVEVFVARGSVWRYWDGPPENVAADWMGPEFDDSAWDSGPAPLGYGDGDEATVIGFGPNPAAKHLKTFFRLTFDVVDPDAYGFLILDIQRDDGVVVYLNGDEAARSRAPGDIVYPVAPDAIENDYVRISIEPEFLVEGRNVIAVELRQSEGSTTDASFDLEALGTLRSEEVTQFLEARLNTTENWKNPLASANRWAVLAGGYGEVFLYYRDPDTGMLELRQTLVDPQPSNAPDFGYSVDLTDNYLVVGAPQTLFVEGGEPRFRLGAVVIYRMDPETETWILDARILPETLPSDPNYYQFGELVALSDSTLAVAARGAVHIYRRSSERWVEAAVLPLDPYNDLDLSTDTLAIARSSADVGSFRRAGEVTLYRRSENNVWTELQTLTPPHLDNDVFFGRSVTIDGRRMLIRARGELESARQYYFYEQSLFGNWRLVQTISERRSDSMPVHGKPVFQGDIAAAAIAVDLEEVQHAVDVFHRCHEDGQWRISNRIHLQSPDRQFPATGFLAMAGGDLMVSVSQVEFAILPIAGGVDILSEPPVQAIVRQEYQYPVEGVAGDGSEVVFAMRSGPSWLKFRTGDDGKQALAGTPIASAAGLYDVVIEARSAAGIVATQSYALSVIPESSPPRIVEAPHSMRLVEGRPLSWRVVVHGEGEVLYQWYRDGEALQGEDGALFDRVEVALADGGSYQVEVRNVHGSQWSEPAILEVLDVEFPTRTSLVPGDYDSLAVALENAGPGPWTVLIQGGHHSGRLEIHPYRIHIRGLDGAGATVLDFLARPAAFRMIRGSIVEGVTLRGVDTLTLEEDVIVRDCVFQGDSNMSPLLDIGSGAVIERNQFRGTDRRFLFRLAEGSQAVFVNNLVHAEPSEALFWGSPSSNIVVAHNNFIDCPSLVLQSEEPAWASVAFENNIIANFERPVASATVQLSRQPGFRGNLLWPQIPVGGTVEEADFLSRGNLTADPRFVAGGTGNFELWNDSPAIDSAVDGFVVEDDLYGLPRPQGSRNDRGAIEFQVEQSLPPVDVSPGSLIWRIFEDVAQMNPLVNIASPSGKPVAWEVRRAPAWLKLEPDRGETPTQALLRFQWGASGPVGAEGELVIGSGDYEVAIPVRAFVSQFWSSARWLEYNPADGHYYTESVGVYRIDPRSGLLDGRSLNLSSLADESLLAMNPLNGRIVSPLRAPSIATPRFAVLEPGSDYFVPAGGPQPISRSVGLAWIGAGSVASIDRSNDIFVSDLDGETVVDTYDFELVNSVRAFAGDVAGARWWISHTVSERQTPHVALSAFALEGSEIRLVASHIEDLAEWNPERPPLVFDPVADRVYWEGKVLDGGLTPVEGLSATILEVIPGAGIGFDAWGALDLDAGVRLLAWNEEAQRLAVGEEGPGLLIQTPAEPRLRLLPLDVVREAAEEFRGDREPAFLVRAVAPDHPEWTAIVFSVAETGVYRVQRSTNGTSWPSLTSAEVLTRGWHTRWVRSPATPAGAPVLYRVAKVMQN